MFISRNPLAEAYPVSKQTVPLVLSRILDSETYAVKRDLMSSSVVALGGERHKLAQQRELLMISLALQARP